MLEGLFHHKKEEKEYLCALLVSEDRIDAAILETGKDGSGNVLKVSIKEYLDSWDNAINAADAAVTEIEDILPEGKELTKVIFGLFPEWLHEDRIKDTYLKKLKQLTTSLSLTPMGFVELPLAIEHLLHRDEGTQQTVVLVGVESKHITVSLFKIGKSCGSVTSERTENVTTDVEKALGSFMDVEVLPSRVLLYGTSGELEKLKDEMLNYPWQKKANFIHFPRIEVLKNDFSVKAVAIASSSEIIPHTQEEHADLDSSSSAAEITNNRVKTALENEKQKEPDEVAEIAQDLGFIKDKDVTGENGKIETDLTGEEISNVEAVSELAENTSELPLPSRKLEKKLSLSCILSKLTFKLKLPRNTNALVIVTILIILIILGAAGIFAYWSLPYAQITLLVSHQNLNQTERITVDLKASSVDTRNKVLPGKEINVESKGTKSIETSGKKTIGEKAKGEVTIYNKTLNTKQFKKGTIIIAGKLKFTLDDDTKIASASENVGSLSYGTVNTSITAVDIGTAANIGPGTELAFADLPTNLYSARNEKAFSGGTSKEVAVVSRDDQKSARDKLQKDLEKQAQQNLSQKITASEKVLSESIKSKISKEIFNKEVGEEGDQLGLEMTVEVTALTYSQSDFLQLLDSVVKEHIPPNYEYKADEADISVEDITAKDGVYSLTIDMKLKLYPKLDTKDLPKKLAGKSVVEATELLRATTNVSGVEFNVNAPLESMKKSLPINPQKISIVITSL